MPNFTRIMFVRHKQKEILQLDFSECLYEELVALITKSRDIITQQPPNSLRVLTKALSKNNFPFLHHIFGSSLNDLQSQNARNTDKYSCALAQSDRPNLTQIYAQKMELILTQCLM